MSDDKLSSYHEDVKEAIEGILALASEREWSYMVLFGACKSLAESTDAVLRSGLAKEWDEQSDNSE